MSPKTLSVIAVGIVVLGSVFYSTAPKENQSQVSEVVNLLEDVNGEEVSRIVITQGKNKVLLSKEDNLWVLPEKDSYPANLSKVRSLMLKLLSLQLTKQVATVENKFEALGVANSSVESGSAKVSFQDSDGSDIASVFLGNERKSSSPGSVAGQYVRKEDSKRVYLASDKIALEASSEKWLKEYVIDLLPSKVRKVYQTKQGEDSEGVEFTLVAGELASKELQYVGTIPDGYKLQDTVVKQIGSGVQGVRVIDVAKRLDASKDDFAPDYTILYYLDDGSIYQFKTMEREDKFYARISVQLDDDAAKTLKSAKADLEEKIAELEVEIKALDKKDETLESSSESSADVKSLQQEDSPKKLLAEAKKQLAKFPVAVNSEKIDELNKIIGVWTYELPNYVASRLRYGKADILQEVVPQG